MIKELHIQNFQSHKDTRLKFHPGVNIVVGTSDSGKSAIIRALRWAVWNKPLGDAYRSRWGGDTSVQVKTTDDTITRFKGKGGDRYVLDSIPEPFRAFGVNVPQEIEEAGNFTEVNLQSQMDSHFLLSANPGEVARHFNKIARIDAIDTGLQEVERWVRAGNQDISKTQTNIAQYVQEVERYSWLEEYEIRLEAVEALWGALHSTQTNTEALDSLIRALDESTEARGELGVFLEMGEVVEAISDMYDELDGHIHTTESLHRTIRDLGDLQLSRQEYTDLAGVDTTHLDELLGWFADVESLRTDYTNLIRVGKEIKQVGTDIKEAQQVYNTKHTKLLTVGDLCASCPFI